MKPVITTEAERLRALADYQILDSAPEQAFDDLTTLATLICGVEMSLITLIDAKRQWFKSRVGIDFTETPREHSFCAHALHNPGNLTIVPDATRDPRFARNPYVTGAQGVRFYAGAPLLSNQGYPLGTLCVIDRKPRELAAEQLHALRILGRQASQLLELRRVSMLLAGALRKSDGGNGI